MAASDSQQSFRDRHVDDTLDEHDQRISRLEKGSLLAAGYLLAEGSNFVTDIVQVI